MTLKAIFDDVKESFCSLWTFKERGRTLEIITPFSTTNSKFISVFITQQGNNIIVSDGGWLLKGEYNLTPDFYDESFLKIFYHYETFYDILKLEETVGTFYFKMTQNSNLVPNLVYDVSNFLSTILSISQIQFQDVKEKEEKENFRKLADNYLASLVSKERIKFHKELGDNYKTVRFNAIISRGPKIKLVKYITGSTPNYFLSSLTKATVDFEIANNSPFNEFIEDRIALINDLAPGYNQGKLYRYLETLQDHTQSPSINWTERENLIGLISTS